MDSSCNFWLITSPADSVLLKKLGKSFKTETLKHEDVNVPLALGGNAIMAVFDVETQILSHFMDESIMQKDNIAHGYDIFTGIATCPNLH